MPIRIDDELSFAIIAGFALLLVAGLVIICKVRGSKVADLSPVVTLQPVPAMAHKNVTPPHGFRGLCHFCHPVATDVLPAGGLGGLPRKGFGASAVAWRGSISPPSQRAIRGQIGGSRNPAWGGRFSEGQQAALRSPGQAPARADVPPLNLPARTGETTGILTPAEQNAASKMLVEGHWLGIEALDLTPSLRRTYGIPAHVNGVLIDEVSLEAAEAGLLAGDVITEVEGRPTPTLEEFLQATIRVCTQKKAEIVVNRLGAAKTLALVAKNSPMLGFAQMESASPIRPGALSPHRNRNKPCTSCHVIMQKGGQLAIDAGDITPSPPPIARNARAPHRYRGPCNSCHQVIK